MNIVQITPGAGSAYCGNCLRDNALVATLRQWGHEVLMVPLYLPLTLDEADQSEGTPIFFSGINVYLEQKSEFFQASPQWFRDLMRSPPLLKWAAGKAAKTRAQDVGDLTLSMLQGETGNQNRDLTELIAWLKQQPKPDVVCLSNVLLVGMARRLRNELDTRVVCMLQGEDWFLDALPEAYREACWRTVSERASETDMLIASSHYFGNLMAGRLKLPDGQVKIAWNGINLKGFEGPRTQSGPPVLGYFARMCAEKGLDTLVDAYLVLRKSGRNAGLRLRIGGSCGPTDETFLDQQLAKLRNAGLENDVEVRKNVSRDEKLSFLKSLTVFSVPARYGEAFGLYVVEAMAAGVPVVQPHTASYPELIEATGGGLLCKPEDPTSLAEKVERLLQEPEKLKAMGESAQRAVFEKFSAEAMSRSLLKLFEEARGEPAGNRKAIDRAEA